MNTQPKLLILTGATATGKSAFVYRCLHGLPLTIINADSRQVYRNLRISSAGPGDTELAIFPHKLYQFQNELNAYSAGEYARMARGAIAESRTEGRIPVLCGGTYFYIQALLNGLLPALSISAATTATVDALSSQEAFALLTEKDALAASRVHANNTYRVKRALSICIESGQAMSSIPRTPGVRDDFDILMLIFTSEKQPLLARISERVDTMFRAGLTDEIAAVFTVFQGNDDPSLWRQVPAFTGIGVREFFEMAESEGVLPDALLPQQLHSVRAKIIQNTLGLVKRQLTWFRNAPGKPLNTKTVDPAYENERIVALVKDFLG